MNIMMVHLRNIGGIAGGLEKVLCQFSNEMARRGHTVSVVIYDDSGKDPYYSLKSGVRLINIYERRHEPKKMSFLNKTARELSRLRGHVEAWYEQYRDPFILPSLQEVYHECRPDVILNQYYTSSGFVYASNPSCPIINMLHSDPKRIFCTASPRERAGMANSSLVQVLLPSFLKYIKNKLPETPAVWVPNAVYPALTSAKLRENRNWHTIIHVGRFDKDTKRQHLLVAAFSKISDQFPSWNVNLFGEGDSDYKEELIHLIKQRHLENRVFFCGTTSDIMNRYSTAEIFAFPSAYEGWGLALTEAMSVGLPVVAYTSCQACADLIQDGKTGLLSDDGVDSFAGCLSKLMGDQKLRIALGENARESMGKFSPVKVWDKWENILTSVVSKSYSLRQ